MKTFRVIDGKAIELGGSLFAGNRIKSRRLGDRLEQTLTRMGITKDRYKEVKQRFGFPPTCNCDKRKEWLNKVGRWAGIGK